MAFISWLLHKGQKLSDVAQGLVKLGAGATFKDLYQSLTGDNANPWPSFIADVKMLPGITTDNPFNGTP
jgi:hypothetical protein